MARPRSVTFATPVAAVRAHFGLSVQQLADWLGVSVGFAGALDGGRKAVPAALVPRLLPLLHHLPPPLGDGPPAPPPLPAEPPLVGTAPAFSALLPPAAAATDPLGVPDAAALRAAARAARLVAARAERDLLRLHARALALTQRRHGLARLRTVPPPPDPAAAARWAAWVTDVAAALAAADPAPARAAAERYRLAARAAAAAAEAATLEALADTIEKIS